MGSKDTTSATYLNKSVDLMEEWTRGTSPMLVPIHQNYPIVHTWLQNWPLPFQACLLAGENPTSGYQLLVELSQEEGDYLIGRLMENLAEEEVEIPRLEDYQNSEEWRSQFCIAPS